MLFDKRKRWRCSTVIFTGRIQSIEFLLTCRKHTHTHTRHIGKHQNSYISEENDRNMWQFPIDLHFSIDICWTRNWINRMDSVVSCFLLNFIHFFYFVRLYCAHLVILTFSFAVCLAIASRRNSCRDDIDGNLFLVKLDNFKFKIATPKSFIFPCILCIFG